MEPQNSVFAKTIVIVPAYNEEKTINGVLSNLLNQGFSYILVVNDGSKDQTEQISLKREALVISHPVNMGYGAALRTGFEYAIKTPFEYVITFDADGQMKAEDAVRILNEAYEHNYDYVYGCRNFNHPNVPKIRKFIGILADVLTFLLAGTYVRDTQSGLRCIKTSLLKKFKLKSRGFSIPSELVIEAIRNGVVPKPVEVKAIYTKESLKKGQKISNSFRVIKELLG